MGAMIWGLLVLVDQANVPGSRRPQREARP
jgi:hypothetical protein